MNARTLTVGAWALMLSVSVPKAADIIDTATAARSGRLWRDACNDVDGRTWL
jgi:hypothetical protein